MPRITEAAVAGRQPPTTVCKLCWKAVYGHEDRVWVVSPAPGLAHRDCATTRTRP